MVDELQIKIERARAKMSKEARDAIDAVDWRSVVYGMRDKKGYSVGQLEDLELETELLLCGLVAPEEYPKELEARLGIPRHEVDLIVEEMNQMVFKKIRQELIKRLERSKLVMSTIKSEGLAPDTATSLETKSTPRQEITKVNIADLALVKPEINKKEIKREPVEVNVVNPKDQTSQPSIGGIGIQKLAGTFQVPAVSSDHSTQIEQKPTTNTLEPKKLDPYREIPD